MFLSTGKTVTVDPNASLGQNAPEVKREKKSPNKGKMQNDIIQPDVNDSGKFKDLF